MNSFQRATGYISPRLLLQIAISLLITLSAWSLSNPPGSTPDEFFTIGSIWCANGVDNKHCLEMYPPGTKQPIGSALIDLNPSSCVVNKSDVLESCRYDPGIYVRSTGGYPVWFYKVMNLFVSIPNSLDILSMRFFNLFLASTLFMVQLLTLNRNKRVVLATTFSMTMFPMGFFLLSSIHPSGWAITSVANGWLFILTATDRLNPYKWKRYLAWLSWFACLVLAAASRYEAILFFFISNFITVVATRRLNRLYNWKVFTPIAFLSVLGAFALFKFNEITKWLISFPITPDYGRIENGQWITHWLLHTIAIPVEALGTGLIGQRPLRIPDIVWIIGIACLGGALLISFMKSSATQLTVFCGSLLMLSFIILSLNGRQERDFFNLSGRYIFPLVPFIVGLCLFLSKSQFQLMEIRSLRVLVVTLLSTTHAVALHSVVETYVDGQSYAFLPISVGESGWWWIGLPFGPNFIVLVGALSFAKFLTLIWATVPTVQISVIKSVEQ
jgi:hypothetical protein